MAPKPTLLRRLDFAPDNTSSELNKQWTQPSDVFSVLLILGGDVVARALAQSTGWTIGLPSFSFGWVAYSINALTAAVGENKLMPQPDYSCLIINGETGYARQNRSWIIGRMMRDFDFWMPEATSIKVKEIVDAKWIKDKADAKDAGDVQPDRPSQAGLCVSIFEPVGNTPSGKMADYLLVGVSLAVALLQLIVAAIPCSLFGDWSILMITAAGILLSSLTASLPQWRKEKWSCRRQVKRKPKNIILTTGNGSQDAIVILGKAGFPDLEDLSSGQTDVTRSLSRSTRLALISLALGWILLLITAAGLEANTWFLLAVGGIGILFNVYAAGKQNDPKACGMPLKCVQVLGQVSVMATLYQVEEAYPYVGRSLRNVYFPGELREHEQVKWNEFKVKADLAKKNAKQIVSATNVQVVK